MMLTTKKKQVIIGDHQRHKTDTGSAEVQVALLTKSVAELTGHLKEHPKDNHSRRGLLKMVGKRKRLLDYLAKNDAKRHASIIRKLGLKNNRSETTN
ncbi:30S ribosomal protein S15 [Candidatus Wolfebacteria bacterium]|nr:30S ribosomal protein S15 [Candidatus Wolfebacteria bacterium]